MSAAERVDASAAADLAMASAEDLSVRDATAAVDAHIYPRCDNNLVGNDALTHAKALGLCPPWLLTASFDVATDPRQHRVSDHFGARWTPQSGKAMVVFSTGVAADEKDPGFAVPQPGTAFTGSETNLFPAPFHGPCAGNLVAPPMTLNDPAALTITAQAPPDATGFRFRFNFFTSEFPEFIGDQMADTFVVWLDSKALKKNIAFDANGDAITANSPSLQVCTPQQVCQGGRLVPCSAGAGGLAGTGYELDNGLGVMIGGATGWLSTSAPIAAGETFRVTFLIFDAGDHVLDSAVLIDNWEWVTR